MKTKKLEYGVSNFKYDQETGEFSCYGNVKGNIDHAQDRTLDGAYRNSIKRHEMNGTMPKMFWMHNPFELPVGKWLEMREDEKGLFLRGKLSKTSMGRDIEILARDGALDSFSIGYTEVQSKWNHEKGCNDLIELDIKEISWVTFAANEESRLVDIKSKLSEGGTPTKAELRELLKSIPGLSKRHIERITSAYKPEEQDELSALLAGIDVSELN